MNIKDLSSTLNFFEPLLVSDLRELAKCDIRCHYLYLTMGMTRDEVGTVFANLLKQKGPIHAFCRSGMHSTTLWDLSQDNYQPLADIVTTQKLLATT
jgi:sulfide:quinone oxidoreductase